MLRYLAIFLTLSTTAAFAQPAPPKSYVLSAPLVDELNNRLLSEMYGNPSGLVARLQAEAQHQPPPVSCPDSIPPEPPPK